MKMINKRLFRTTLDIDTNNKEVIKHHIDKILLCPNLFHLHKKQSSCKGYHFILKCWIDCNLCRIVYDDFRRFDYDKFRPKFAQNILFDRSEII